MRIKEIAVCCHAIDHLRGIIHDRGFDRHDYIEFSSDLLMCYNDLLRYMEEEIEFLKSISIK